MCEVSFDSGRVLSILDLCCDAYTFPMLDNGYVCLAATRLSLYRSVADWAMVIEVFGFSPRSQLPDTHIYRFASQLHDRDTPDQYTGREFFYDRYLANNPNNDSRFVFPIAAGLWQDADDGEILGEDASEIVVRATILNVTPSTSEKSRQPPPSPRRKAKSGMSTARSAGDWKIRSAAHTRAPPGSTAALPSTALYG